MIASGLLEKSYLHRGCCFAAHVLAGTNHLRSCSTQSLCYLAIARTRSLQLLLLQRMQIITATPHGQIKGTSASLTPRCARRLAVGLTLITSLHSGPSLGRVHFENTGSHARCNALVQSRSDLMDLRQPELLHGSMLHIIITGRLLHPWRGYRSGLFSPTNARKGMVSCSTKRAAAMYYL